jgi:hypothetical protein
MALSFLNKKIWHPGSFANMEKTWVTEQKYREVERRAIEKAKKIKEEKVYEEMKKIQVEKGLIPAYHLHRLDFMYQCPQPEKAENKSDNEDFLLGKRLDDDNEENYMKRKKKIVPKFANTYANPQNEEFVRIHEDPLYLILKEEKKQRKEIEQNPYKMKEILNELKNDLNKNDNNNNNNIKLDESEEETEKYNEEEYNKKRKERKDEEKNNYSSHRHHHKSHKKHHHNHHHSSHKYRSKDKHKSSHHHH